MIPVPKALKVLKENKEKIEEKTYTKWLDYDKIQNRVEIRTRKQGDYLFINDLGNKILDIMFND